MLTLKQIYAIFDILGFSVYVTKWTADLKQPLLWKVYGLDGEDLRGEMSLMHLRIFAESFGVNPDAITKEQKDEARSKRALIERKGMSDTQRRDARREYDANEIKLAKREMELAHLTKRDRLEARSELLTALLDEDKAEMMTLFCTRILWLLNGTYGRGQELLAHFACENAKTRALEVFRIIAACEWQTTGTEFEYVRRFMTKTPQLEIWQPLMQAIEKEIAEYFARDCDTPHHYTKSEVLGQ